jgi:hypothetical protein
VLLFENTWSTNNPRHIDAEARESITAGLIRALNQYNATEDEAREKDNIEVLPIKGYAV